MSKPSTPLPLTHLGDMPIETFLKEYWQKKPLLIPNAIQDIPSLTPDEIAGFALEDGIESRVIIETPNHDRLQSLWELITGPLDDTAFERLPESHWTLLIQAVDQLHPEVHELLHKFRFIPNWRVDDIMVSYAADQGNVGPHFDYYDVFLLQAQGSRLWKLGDNCDANSPLRHDSDCKILTGFTPQQEWTVNPGDLLYIPPNVSHWGIAQGECVTYSVGFRAPSHSEILLEYTQELASTYFEDQRYSDHSLSQRANPGAITGEDIQQLKSILKSLTNDEKQLSHWFARYMTQSQRDAPTFEQDVAEHPKLAANSRAAYIEDKEFGTTTLFVNGESYPCSLSLAQSICSYQDINISSLSQNEQDLAELLLEQGVLL